jgi:hypothetical protein
MVYIWQKQEAISIRPTITMRPTKGENDNNIGWPNTEMRRTSILTSLPLSRNIFPHFVGESSHTQHAEQTI